MKSCDTENNEPVVKPGLGYIDTVLTKCILPTLPAWRAMCVTPNMLTTLGLITSVACVYSLYHRKYVALTLLFMSLRCYFDYADGLMARKYNQVTVIGDWYDHIVDVLFAIGLLAVLALSRYSGKLKCALLVTTSIFALLFLVQMGCIERKYREQTTQKPETTISHLRVLCPESSVWLVNAFDNGTLYTVLAIVISIFHMYT